MTKTEEINRNIIERYPFLMPAAEKDKESFDYSYTMLDFMPDGWRYRFGIEMCEKIRETLLKSNDLYNYQVIEIKEKFGSLRWYSDLESDSFDEVEDIIYYYESLSNSYCQACGDRLSEWRPNALCDKCRGSKKLEEK